jgi:hypothetical protein
MTDDRSEKGPADRARINIHEPYEVRYWTEKLDCTKARLEVAVKTVGVMAKDVAEYLRARR